MKKLLALFLFAALTVCAHSATLTNADVLKLHGAGLSPDLIVNSVKAADSVAFDLTPEGLIALKTAGVPDSIIAQMQVRASGVAAPAAAQNGIYFTTAGKTVEGSLLPAPKMLPIEKGRNTPLWTARLKGITANFAGNSSNTPVGQDVTIRVVGTRVAPKVARFDLTKHGRTFYLNLQGEIVPESLVADAEIIPDGPNAWAIRFATPLPVGSYALSIEQFEGAPIVTAGFSVQ